VRELKASLSQLSAGTARGVVQRVLLRRVQPIVDAAKAKAPVEYGDLRDSIHSTTQRPRGYKSESARAYAQALAAGGSKGAARAAAKAAGKSPIEVFLGPGRNPQAVMMEFGTSHNGPRPYLRPAYDQNKDKVAEGIGADIKAEYEKTIARIAKRNSARKS
jgi:HK97 gp10 family phage protein